MKINILKDITWINELEQYNKDILEVCDNYTFLSTPYDTKKNEASYWFKPINYNRNPLSKTYPYPAIIQSRPEYKLIEYLPNYLSLFVIKELYSDRKKALIEDFGAGMGKLFFFLSKLGFTDFNIIENFSQLPKQLLLDMMSKGDYWPSINDLQASPVIVNNCGAPFTFITHGLDPDGLFLYKKPTDRYRGKRDFSQLELICFYSNLEFEKLAIKILKPMGYSFLCEDNDNIGNVWCRNDKLEEFTEKLTPYEY